MLVQSYNCNKRKYNDTAANNKVHILHADFKRVLMTLCFVSCYGINYYLDIDFVAVLVIKGTCTFSSYHCVVATSAQENINGRPSCLNQLAGLQHFT